MGAPSLLLLSFLCYCTYGLDLTAYQTASYVNPVGSSEFTHFVTHNVTGTVYIGASDALYQLREDFTREQVVNTEVECEEGFIECRNYNKILLIDYAHNRLITCGSEDTFVDAESRGTCQTRDLTNIEVVLQEDDSPVVASGKLTTEAIIGPGPLPADGSTDTLYVGATYEEERYSDVYPMSRRSLNVSDDLLFTTERDAWLLLDTQKFPSIQFIINYVSVFIWKDFTYFVTTQRKDADLYSINVNVSKINRVCHNQAAFSGSYAEILLECSASGTNYNLIQSAHVGPAGTTLAESLSVNAGDDVLYGVFAKNKEEALSSDVPSIQSALCVYKLQDIEEAFIDAIYGCLTGGVSFELFYALRSSCGENEATRDSAIAQQCNAQNWEKAGGTEPLVSTAAIEWTDILPSSIITTTHRDHTVGFIGTTKGELVKVHIESKTSAREYERFSMGSPVLRDAEISGNQMMVTLLTEQTLVKLQVENCLEYTSCEDCIGVNGGTDGDPYCGWCTLEKRCTRYDACPMPDVSTRWLAYNNAQCISISNITPSDRLPITETQQTITLTMEELPDLKDDHSYQCVFDESPPSVASKFGNELSCTTPAGADIPPIQPGNEHVTMQLYVFSTETQVKFVQRDFHFYECDSHKMCVACTNSVWACDWCIYSNQCTHDNSTCSEDDQNSIINGVNKPDQSPRQGYEWCPQLTAQSDEILVSDGVSKSISVTGTNLPAEDRASNYKCVLDIEGKKSETEATRSGDVFTCNARMYNYDSVVQELPVGLSVLWNGVRRLDDVFGFKVTLYNCAVNRPDCSRCRSSLTSRSELNCGWCSMNNICTVEDSSDCSGGWISSSSSANCPNPFLVEVFPSSGPLQGNTTITISGTDLGKQFMDIVSITVGGEECSTDGLGERYKAASSVSCKTLPGRVDSMAPIVVTVTGANGNPQQSTGEVLFTYRDPSITSFEPMEGFAAGGTMVTITGQYLDACSEISATIGSDCIMNRMDDVLNETTAMCRTTSSPTDSSHPLVVSFDGATRESLDTFTYKPNPTVSDVQPLKTIISGGITLTVTGKGFGLAQQPQMVMYIGNEQFKEKCEVHNDTMILCKTPDTTTSPDNVSRRRKRAPEGQASFGFIIGDVMDLLRWSDNNNVTLEYYEDPMYFPFEENPKQKSGDVQTIMGANLDIASFERDVTVYIGSEPAETIKLATATLTITLPKRNPGKNCINGNKTTHPCVVVRHGNLEFDIGSLQYPSQSNVQTIILSVVVTFVLVLLVLLVIALAHYVVQHRKLLRERDALILERLVLLQKKRGDTTLKINKPIVLPNNVHINEEDVRIKYSQLVIGKVLGKGEFGEVFAATLHMTDESGTCKVAVKTIRDNSDPSSTIKFLEEGLLMKDCDHLNVLGLVGLTFDPNGNPLIILPLMSNGDLRSFLKKAPKEVRENQSLLLTFALGAARGMEYLAGKKFVHRDLAARNCMVDENLIVKIADFGLTRDLNESDYYVSGDIKAKLPVKWMAPESLDRKVYNEKTDVWSFGVLMWEVFSHGQRPYNQINNRDMYYHIEQGNRLPCPTGCHEEIYTIMLHCWEQEGNLRCTFQEVFVDLAVHQASQVKVAALPSLHGQISANDNTNEGACEEMGQHSNQDISNQAERASYLNPIAVADTDDDVVTIEMDTRNSYLEILGDAEIGEKEDPTTVADTEMDNKNSYHEIIDDAEIGEEKDDDINVKDNIPLDYVNEDVVMKRQKGKGQAIASTE